VIFYLKNQVSQGMY